MEDRNEYKKIKEKKEKGVSINRYMQAPTGMVATGLVDASELWDCAPMAMCEAMSMIHHSSFFFYNYLPFIISLTCRALQPQSSS